LKKFVCFSVSIIFLILGCAKTPANSQSESVASSTAASSQSSQAESYMPSSSATSDTDTKSNDEYKYKIVDGSVTIVKYIGSATDVVIPDTIAGLPVKVIGEGAFKENKTIKNLVISDNIITIEKYALFKCFSLESVQFGNNLEIIKENSFFDCLNLKQVTVNKKLKEIGDESFYGCNELETINLPESVESIGESAFSETAIKEFVFPSKIKVISRFIFCDSDLETAILPEKVESIDAALGQSKLSALFIPDSVKSISDQAFNDCPRELVLLYDNNPFVPEFAEENNILYFKRSEYNPVLTVELINGKPLNDDKNRGISSADYNLVKRRNQTDVDLFMIYVSNEYIDFAEVELNNEIIKTKLSKTATLLYQCGITGFDPADIINADSDYLDKMAIFTIYSRSKEEIEEEDEKGSTGVLFADDNKLYANYEIFFGTKPDLSKFTGYSQQQKGFWYYPKEFPKMQAEVLSFDGNLNDGLFTLKVKFTDDLGATCEKTFSYLLVKFNSVGGTSYRVMLKGIQ